MRNRGLSTTRGRFFSRFSGVHPMNLSRGASLQAAVEKPSNGQRPAVSVVDGVAHLSTDQGPVSEIVVAGDELVPQPAPRGSRVRQGASPAGGPRRGRSGPGTAVVRCRVRRRSRGAGCAALCRGGGSAITPSRCMASMVTRAIMSLRPPSGLSQPMRRQNSLDNAARLGLRLGGDQGAQQRHLIGGEVAPVVAALDRAAHPRRREFAADAPRSSTTAARARGCPAVAGRSRRRPSAMRPASAGRRCRSSRACPRTEYMIAVNLGTFLAVGAEATIPVRLPAPRNSLSARLLSIGGTWGRSTKTHSPLAVIEEGAQRLALRARWSGRPASSSLGVREQAHRARPSSIGLGIASNAGAWRFEAGVVMLQPRPRSAG